MKRLIVVTALALSVCGATFAQQQTQASKEQTATGFSYTIAGGAGSQEFSYMGRSVKNAPYTAKQTHESTQTLSDGTRITNKSVTTLYRDSAGRTRTDASDESVTIFDPVAGATYRLNPKAQTARVVQSTVGIMFDTPTGEVQAKISAELNAVGTMVNSTGTLPKVTVPNGVTVTEAGYTTNNVTRESLGSQNIEGLVAEGTRITTVIPEGAMGNDRPIKIVTERWYSPELQLYVMTKTSDPRFGESVTQLTEVQRNEPDASLFQVPAGYKVVSGGGGGGGRGGAVITPRQNN
jgi:hypothetical protein